MRAFGEIEFWFSIIKIVAIIALVVVGIVLVVIGFASPNGAHASVTNLWRDGGMFPNGFHGFTGAFQIAVFAFVGTELIGTAAAEAKDPEVTLPKAINAIPVRIVIFYLGALAAIMSVTPWPCFHWPGWALPPAWSTSWSSRRRPPAPIRGSTRRPGCCSDCRGPAMLHGSSAS